MKIESKIMLNLSINSKWQAIIYGFIFGFFTISISIFFAYLIDNIYPSAVSGGRNIDTVELIIMFVSGVVIFPAIETLIFQMLIFELIGFEKKGKLILSLFCSVIIFSAAHIFSGIHHAAMMIVVGFLFACIDLVARKKSKMMAFLTTAAAHTSHNLIVFFLLIKYPDLA